MYVQKFQYSTSILTLQYPRFYVAFELFLMKHTVMSFTAFLNNRVHSALSAPIARSKLDNVYRESFTRYCVMQTPRQTRDNPQNKLRGITQNSSSTIGLHVYHVFTLEISRQKVLIPSSGGCLLLGIRGQNRTTRKKDPSLHSK